MSDRAFVSPEIHYSDLEVAPPQEILWWAATTIDRLAVATSFQGSGLVILHMLRAIRPDLPVLFLDTGFHFDETLAFKDEITKLFDLNLVELRGEHGSVARQNELYGEELFRRDPSRCCEINKVLPLQRALENYDGWISGLRRDQSPLRSETPMVEAQMLASGNEVLKIHPLAHWTKADVQRYLVMHGIPTNPLLERGFASIGCYPCTRAIADGEDERAGRWDGNSKTECGIHLFGKPGGPKQSEAEE
ncbi:MAG: phosphoadenylyl-sulfate reductase [Actinomycetota bacterium]